MRHFLCRWLSLGALTIGTTMVGAPGPSAGSSSVSLTVSNLPSAARLVPVSYRIDFTKLSPQPVEEQTLRLYQLDQLGGARELVFQFSPEPRTRPRERTFSPSTRPGVSYLAEYSARAVTNAPQLSGTLTWLARPAGGSAGRYRLDFGWGQAARLVQVPYSPQNLRAFDARNRAVTNRWFSTLEIRPKWPLSAKLGVFREGKLFAEYHMGPDDTQRAPAPGRTRRPFIYPVIGPDDLPLTEFGKSHDPRGTHAHHYSLWIAHGNVAGRDFWSENGGAIVHREFETIEDGPLFAVVALRNEWKDADRSYLVESRTLRFFAGDPDVRWIDVDLQLHPSGAAPVVLGKTSFGFLAARVATSMTVFDGGGEMLNAGGDRNEQEAHLRRSPWLDLSGPIGPGKWGGIALFDHPANANHPTTWHCRNDGWACASFSAEAPYTLEPGKELRLRYRILLHKGNATDGTVARRYGEFIAEPRVQLTGGAKHP